MKKISLAFVLLLHACGHSETSPVINNKEESAPQYALSDAEILASNLSIPWDIAKKEDTFYISERAGQIIQIQKNGQKTNMKLTLTKDISHEGEGGLLGFELDPQFQSNSLAYVYHTYKEGETVYNRIVQVEMKNNEWVETKELLASIPGGRIHNGGRLAIGPDQTLYATAGDAGIKENAQNLDSLSGKILRLNLDGTIPNDNPFPQSYVYSWGHRNPQGLAWSDNGTMFASEHGQTAHDEINLIRPGKNYGWPIIEGDEKKAGMETPLFHSGDETWAPSGMAYDEGRLYVATLAGQKLLTFDLENRKVTSLVEEAGRLRDVMIENNQLYLLTNNTDGRGTPKPDDDHLVKIDLSKSK
ncbi:PQQ-dependent sugar dehydrogenase [Bacillus sp. FJAT-52991]|uniref:PQQ-dependent sugar dehydrogenase n=1 Tax=Bacillus kandeliae TaxID=3129297 RepID=A0ABZ2N2G9_9BACI